MSGREAMKLFLMLLKVVRSVTVRVTHTISAVRFERKKGVVRLRNNDSCQIVLVFFPVCLMTKSDAI